MAPAETYKALCQRCHGEKGDGEGKVAWYLDPSPRDLTKAAFMNSKTRERFVNSIQEGVAGTSMPSWKNALKSEQVNGVLTYVLATFTKEPARELKPHNVPDTNPVPQVPLPSNTASRSSSSAAPAVTAARPTAKGRTRSTSRPGRATCAIRPSSPASMTAGSSTPCSTACKVRPCLAGSITASPRPT